MSTNFDRENSGAAGVWVSPAESVVYEELVAAISGVGSLVVDEQAARVSIWVLDGTSGARKRFCQTARDPARATLVVCTAGGAIDLQDFEVPATWVLLAWPAPADWVPLSIKRARELSHLHTQKHVDVDAGIVDTRTQDLAITLSQLGLFEFEYDLETGNRRPNPRDHLVFGHSPESFEHSLTLVHPDDRERLRDSFAQCRLRGCPYRVRMRAKLNDSDYRWIRSEGAVVGRSALHAGRLHGVSWDIHEEQLAEAASRHVKFRLSQALLSANTLMWDWDPESNRRRIVGDDSGLFDVVAGADWKMLEDFVCPEDLDLDRSRFSEALRQCKPYESEVRFRFPDKDQVRWLQLTGYPELDASGQVRALSGLGLDVTTRRMTQEELADARALLLDSLSAGQMYCWEWNLADNSRRTIGPSAEILGIDPGSVVGAQSLVHPQDKLRDDALWKAAVRTNAPYANSFRIIRPDGAVRWLHSSGRPIADQEGRITRFSGVAIDVTDRQRAEHELAIASQRLQIALDAAKLNAWSVDLSSDQHHGGPQESELFGQPIFNSSQLESVIVHEDRHLVKELRSETFLQSGNPKRVEFRIRKPDGSIRWIASHAQAVMDEHGVPVQLVGVSHDISEAREAQDRLAQSLTRLDRVLAATGVSLWEWDRKSGLHFLQAAGIETGQGLSSIHRADRRRTLRRFVGCLRGHHGLDEEFRIGNNAQGYRWVAVQGGRTGNQGQLAGVMIDISARKLAANELALAQERLSRALVAARMVCWDWIADRRPGTSYIPMVAGGPPNQRDGVVHPDDRERHQAAIVTALSGPEGDYRCEFRVLRPNGSITWLLSIGSRILDSVGSTVGLTGVAIDITSQKNTELDLAESREWQRLAAAAGELNLWRVDIATGQRRGGDLDVQLFGYAPSNVAEVEELIHPDDRERVDEAWRQSVEAGTPYSLDYRIRLKNGAERWLRVRGKCLRSPRTGLPQMVGASLDISEQVQTEVTLRLALQRAEQASAAKSAFLAGISHELRTPLNAVIGHAGLLARSAHDPKVVTQINWLSTAANQLYALVNNVLDFSRIEAGEVELEYASFDLLDCIEPAIDMVANEAEAKGLCLLMLCAGANHYQVLGDLTRVRQVAINLLANATKFTEKGVVSLELEIADRGAKIGIVIRIRDTGIGMTQNVRHNLFKAFQQGDASTTRRFGGTGLGLSISKKLVDLMNGQLSVTSYPSIGSCFEVHLDFDSAYGLKPPLSRLTGRRVGLLVMSEAMRGGLISQLRAFGGDPVIIDRGIVSQISPATLCDLDALVVGAPMLDSLDAIERWPLRKNKRPLAVVVLVDIEHSMVPWSGRHGEHYFPISRAIKPRSFNTALFRAIAHGGPTTAGEADEASAIGRSDAYGEIRTLVAEDNEINQTLILLQLQAFGINAKLVDSGHAVLEALLREPFDLILMDVEMPGMDGMEAAAKIRSSDAFRHRTPYVMAVTAHVLSDSRERFLSSGMDDFISKPVILDDLRNALDRAVAAIALRRQVGFEDETPS